MAQKSSTKKLLQQQTVSKKTKNINHLDHSLEKDGYSSCHVSSCLEIKKQQKKVVVLGYIDDWSPILLLELVNH